MKVLIQSMAAFHGGFFGRLSNGVVCFLLSFQFDPFCKTVTEVKPHF